MQGRKNLQFFVLFIATVVAIFGVIRSYDTPLNILPEFQPPTIEVQTEALGLSASEVENLVTLNLEEMLTNTPWMEKMRSVSIPSLSSINLKFSPGTDIMDARQMVSENLALSQQIPNVSQKSVILQPRSTTNRVMAIGLSSDDLSLIDISQLSRWSIRPALMSVEGVANVSIWGHRERQLQVQADQEKMRRNRVSLNEIIKTTGNAFWMSQLSFLEASTPGSGGWIDTPNQRLEVRHDLPIQDENDLSEIVFQNKRYLSLGDVADVKEDHQPLIGDAVLDEGKGILLVVEKYPESSVLDVTSGVEEKMDELKGGLSGMEIDTTVFRPATFIETMIDNLTQTFLISSILVLLAFFAFFYRIHIAFLAFLAIALSLIVALFILHLCGVTTNTIMLAGILASLGIIIDQIITAFEKRSRGAIHATLIAVLLVVPVFFAQREFGLFFEPLTLSYIVSVLSGLVVALVVFPALLQIFSSENQIRYREFSFVRPLQKVYTNTLARVIKVPAAIWIILVAVLLAGSITWLTFAERSLLPTFQENNLMVELENMRGTSHSEMNRIVTRIGERLQSIQGVSNFGAHMGRAIRGDQITGMDSAKLWISIDEEADYKETKKAVTDALNKYPEIIKDIGTYSGKIMNKHLGSDDKEIFVRVYGSEFDVLKTQAEEVKKKLSRIDGIISPTAHTQSYLYEPGIQIKVDSASAKRYGLKPGDVRRTAATLVNSLQVANRFEKQKVYQVAVWSTPDGRDSVSDIKNLLIDTPSGGHVRLKEVADVSIVPMLSKIKREGMSRYLDISFEVRERDKKVLAGEIEDSIQGMEFPLEYHAEVLGGYAQEQKEQRRVLIIGLIVAIGTFLILQSAFNSWRLAILSFVTIPTAVSGGIFAAYFADGGLLSLGSLVGLLAIIGVATRNGVMLIGHYKYLEEEKGEKFGQALVIRGAKERLAPILMTAFTIAVAFIPLAIAGNIPGHEIAHPMAIVILGGLVTSTLLNIFIVPALYLWVRNIRNKYEV